MVTPESLPQPAVPCENHGHICQNNDSYYLSLAVGGTDARLMQKDYEAWAFERRMKLDGNVPSWLVKEPTEAMRFGTAVHLACLEPYMFEKYKYVVPAGTNFATKEGKRHKEEFQILHSQNSKYFLLRAEEQWAIRQIADNFRTSMEIDPHYTANNTVAEVAVFRNHKGYQMKGCLDLLTPTHIYDLKTTRSIHKTGEIILDEHYGMQLVHYRQMVPRENLVLVFLESSPPFRVKHVPFPMEMMSMITMVWEKNMQRAIDDGLMIRV